MRIVALDIETLTPGWGPSCKGWKDGKFAPLAYHEPVVIAWITSDGVKSALDTWQAGEGDLRSTLLALADDLRSAKRIVTWNGRGFDMPLLSLVAMEHGIDWSFWLDKRHRFPNYKKPLAHYDMQDQLGDFGAARGLGLDVVARRLGIGGKLDVYGGDVRDIWKDDPALVVRYCCEDVLETLLVYLRWVLTFESPFDEQADAAREQIGHVKNWARNQPQLKRLMGVIDEAD